MKIHCSFCEKEFNRKPSEILKNNFCSKNCFYTYQKNKNQDTKFLNKFVKSSWTNMNIRCGKYKHLQTKEKCKSYENIKIICTREEFKKWCFSKLSLIKKLKRPSIDRKNKNKDYFLNNMQIIELKENIIKEKTVFTKTKGKCRCCKKVLPLVDFCKDARTSNGYTSLCKKCDNIRYKEKYKKTGVK
jgi:hypothetical protein